MVEKSRVERSGVENSWLKSLGLKSPGLRCPSILSDASGGGRMSFWLLKSQNLPNMNEAMNKPRSPALLAGVSSKPLKLSRRDN